jgi:hypothetical protein
MKEVAPLPSYVVEEQEARFRNQSFISTGTGAFFLGATGACASSAGSLFGATGAGASSAGRGRGNRGDDAARCCLVAVPVTPLNQVEMSCAISDKGDRASGRADAGACAWTDAAASCRKNRENAAAFRTLTRTIFPRSAPNGMREEINRN